MKRILSALVMVVVVCCFMACGNSKAPDTVDYSPEIPGKNVGLVFPWVWNGEKVEKGTAAFAIYDDYGTFYIEFNGKGYKLREISPLDVGESVLYYTFTTDWGGTYYLEDVSDASCRIYNN